MTKAELVAKMAEKTGATKAETDKMVNAFITTVRENLQNGGTVKLVGFGTFSVSSRKGRTGRNPQTGEPIEIAASKNVKFKASKDLNNMIK